RVQNRQDRRARCSSRRQRKLYQAMTLVALRLGRLLRRDCRSTPPRRTELPTGARVQSTLCWAPPRGRGVVPSSPCSPPRLLGPRRLLRRTTRKISYSRVRHKGTCAMHKAPSESRNAQQRVVDTGHPHACPDREIGTRDEPNRVVHFEPAAT